MVKIIWLLVVAILVAASCYGFPWNLPACFLCGAGGMLLYDEFLDRGGRPF